MSRVRLDLAYDGSGFSGWAAQPGRRTVQGVVEEALARILRVPVSLTVAGRTDAGVHASGQVAHFDGPLPEVRRLAGVLPPDVSVRSARIVPAGFDARFSALWRRYAYRVTDAPADPLRRHDTLAWSRPLDVDLLSAASDRLVGEHDFAAFCKRREGATTIRALQRLSWVREGDVLTATVVADAFCHSMVRSLVGALLAVGSGQRPVDWPGSLLGAGGRSSAVTVAPAHGLTLVEVGYPADADLAARAGTTRRRRDALPPAGAPTALPAAEVTAAEVPAVEVPAAAPQPSVAAAALTDLLTPYAMRVAASLRIPDLLAGGPVPVGELARRAGADERALDALLAHLVAKGAVTAADGGYATTPLLDTLRDTGPGDRRAWMDLAGAGGRMDLAWGTLLDAVRTGRTAYADLFGRPFWDELAEDPVLRGSFDELMAGMDALWVPQAVATADWPQTGTVVDVGGGAGRLLAGVLVARPDLRGTLVELPAAIERARAGLADLADRVTLHEGSFFDPLPPGDAHVLAQVLHDWPDAEATAILRRCAEAGDRVLVVDRVDPGDGTRPDIAFMTLRMLVLFGARERTVADFEALAAAAGLRLHDVRPLEFGHSVLDLRG